MGYMLSLPTLPAEGFLPATARTAALAEPLACGFGRPGLMVEPCGTGLGFYCHGTPAPVIGLRCRSI
jgi:hypothetical protein